MGADDQTKDAPDPKPEKGEKPKRLKPRLSGGGSADSTPEADSDRSADSADNTAEVDHALGESDQKRVTESASFPDSGSGNQEPPIRSVMDRLRFHRPASKHRR
jgi:hypothetical protein